MDTGVAHSTAAYEKFMQGTYNSKFHCSTLANKKFHTIKARLETLQLYSSDYLYLYCYYFDVSLQVAVAAADANPAAP